MAFPPSSTPQRVLSVGVTGLLLVLALSGCGRGSEEADVVGTATAAEPQSSVSADPSSGESTEYVPATKDHPAQNVPKPVMPAEAHEETDAGARAFLKYWQDSINYFLQTGDSTYVTPLMSPDNNQYAEVLTKYKEYYEEGMWSYGTALSIIPEDDELAKYSDGNWGLLVKNDRSEGGIASKSGVESVTEGRDFNDQPLEAILVYGDGSWKFKGLQAIQDVDYGDK